MGRATAALTALLAVAALVFGVGGASPRALASTDVAVEVIGQGNVQDDKFQLDCGGGTTKCYATYTTDSGQITLTAEAASDWTFSEWSNCSAVNGNECTVNLSGGSGGLPKEIIVSFSKSGAGSAALKVDVAADSQGDLHGDVVAATGSDFEISCGSIGDDECDADPPVGSTFTLYVDDIDAGYAFSGWSGSCDAQRGGEHAYCVVHLTADKTIGASFSQSSTTAKVTVTVTGQGTVTGGGLACTASGGTCSVSVTKGQSVTLEETPQTGATFLGWGGACAGKNPTCTIPQVNADKSVTAQFSGGGGGGGGTVPLTVSVSGPGTVTGSGINCGNGGTTCTASPASGATVTLTATPASGATFQGWGGACSGNSRTCSLTMTAAKSVTATFTSGSPSNGPKRTLSLHVAGAGAVSAPGGACQSTGPVKTCTQTYDDGAKLTLTAVPAKGHKFIRWTGACTGSSTTCSLTMSGPKTVTATFSGAPAGKPTGNASRAALRSLGRPAVHRTRTGYEVTLRFSSAQRGIAHLRAIRAGRLVTGLSFPVSVGIATIGPFPVTRPGFYLVDLGVANHTLRWPVCLGRCGKAAPAPPLVLERELPRVAHGGAIWSVTIRFRTTLAIGARLRIYRGGKLAKDYRFAPEAGMVNAGPFVLSPGTYTLRLNAMDGFGRVRTLTWYALLP